MGGCRCWPVGQIPAPTLCTEKLPPWTQAAPPSCQRKLKSQSSWLILKSSPLLRIIPGAHSLLPEGQWPSQTSHAMVLSKGTVEQGLLSLLMKRDYFPRSCPPECAVWPMFLFTKGSESHRPSRASRSTNCLMCWLRGWLRGPVSRSVEKKKHKWVLAGLPVLPTQLCHRTFTAVTESKRSLWRKKMKSTSFLFAGALVLKATPRFRL